MPTLWLDAALLSKLHAFIIDETGGAHGLRSPELLESALQRAPNRFHYEGVEDLVTLAATYAIAVSGNHPFVDGNKRAAFMALGVFLGDNGLELDSEPEEATRIMLDVASGNLDIEGLTEWLRPRIRAEA